MSCFELHVCPQIVLNISKLSCCKKNSNIIKENDKRFKLIRREQRLYKNLIPISGIYFYMKILSDGNILCYSGEKLIKSFGLKIKDIKETIYELRKKHILFREYIGPVFEQSIQDKEIYQFDFSFNDEEYSCCLYPCVITSDYVSVDIVVRVSHHITSTDIKDFIVRKQTSFVHYV